MRNEKLLKLVALNIGIAFSNIILFSNGLLHVKLAGGSVFESALGFTVIVMSILVFISGNYKLLFEKEKRIQTEELNTPEDCIRALEQSYEKKAFTKDIDCILQQIERFQKKKDTIHSILLEKFSSTEMSFAKFQDTIQNVENVFYLNIKSIVNKISAFDEEDFNQIKDENTRAQFSAEFIQTKTNIYNEYISFVKNSIEDNEQILLKLDKVLFEISKFNSLEDGELENLGAMKEMDDLIKDAKFYK